MVLVSIQQEKARRLLDDEFFKQYPVSEYHGVHHQNGTVIAKISNPMIADGVFGSTEAIMYDGIMQARKHQKICPQDNRNAAELSIKSRALMDVQAEKIRCSIPLERPHFDAGSALVFVRGGLADEPSIRQG